MKKQPIYSNLVAEMARRKITQKELAKILGVNDVGVHNRLYGTIEFKKSEIDKIIYLFNLHYEYLFEECN